MVKAKKFGVFAGVFTPSILTILGVIMYMRLGWVVGQAGLINTIIIILLAHVISLSTGLSISSIATDKKIRAGGIYYILSRSMGLPIGGAIGITLFVGTALSISLYLIGFAESFLSIDPIREFLGLAQDLDGYRIVGSAAILILVIIAFISTSLAIRTQYYILGAIALSLVSIGVGLFVNTGFATDTISITPARDSLPLAAIFAVFFPAVTGFTAGIAMSGDLKDPKKSIPLGTMSAIAVGFVIYILLAIAFALFVDRDILLNNTNFLLQIAWMAPLVIAGIWGATLSSAMGGILGGPRILQAASVDRITPKIFGKGYGVNNEPRNALIFIFLIAEGGILIGELNVIAGIVSMFYLASYGVINIAYFLESWASADFRPTFKINKYIGLVGFVAAFGIMFQLDMISMFAAIIIILSIYFYLKRKQLKLDFGDVWQSVWSSLMRTALQRMDNAEDVERNWQPNIILFSGATQKRPHLLELGKSLVGRHGVLSNFDLTENKEARVLFPKAMQSLPGEVSEKGVFTRRQSVKDIYEGIEMIARTYGFSGLEPNTIMMGWSRQTENPARFAKMLKTIYDLDQNILLVGYDKYVGFGRYKTIDIWFRDKSNLGSLALALSKLLLLSPQWENAKIRVLIENAQNERSRSIIRKAENILEKMRVEGTVKVLNNQIEQRPFYKLVEDESKNTDLVFLRIPPFKRGEERQFIIDTSSLLTKIGTVVLIRAASSFKKQRLLDEASDELLKFESKSTGKKLSIPEIEYPQKPELAEEVKSYSGKLFQLHFDFFNDYYLPLFNIKKEKSTLIGKTIERSFSVLEEKASHFKLNERRQLMAQLKSGLLIRLGKGMDEQQKFIKSEKEEMLEKSFRFMIENLAQQVNNIPEFINARYDSEEFENLKDDNFRTRTFKSYNRFFFKKKLKKGELTYKINFRDILIGHLRTDFYKTLISFFESYGQFSINYIYEYQKLLYAVTDAFLYLERNLDADNFTEIIHESEKSIKEHVSRLNSLVTKNKNSIQNRLLTDVSKTVEKTIQTLQKVPANIHTIHPGKAAEKEQQKEISELPSKWAFNQRILYRSIKLESQLLLMEFRLSKIIDETLSEIERTINEQVSEPVKLLKFSLQPYKEDPSTTKTNIHPVSLKYDLNRLKLNLNRIVDKAFRNIKSAIKSLPDKFEIFTEETTNELTNRQFTNIETLKLPVFRLVDTEVQNNIIAPLLNSIDKLTDTINQNVNKIEDAARLVSLGHQNENDVFSDDEYVFAGNIVDFMNEQQDKISGLQENTEKTIQKFKEQITNKLKGTTDEFHLFRLVKAAEHGTSFQATEAARKRMKSITDRFSNFKNFIQGIQANIWHSQSIASLFANKIIDDSDKQYTLPDRILKFKDSVSPKSQSLNKLPFYYQQLFINKHNYQPEFWVGREKEVEGAKRAIERYQSGRKGCLVITGEWRSGKSFFANYITNKFIQSKPVYTVTPPIPGSTSIKLFTTSLREGTMQAGSPEEMIQALPDGAVVVLEDMELWWERSENGGVLLQYIHKLIQQFADKCLFILVFSEDSYKLINQLVPFQQITLHHVKLSPFNSKELQEIILFRHRTSGFELQVDRTLQNSLTLTRQARLFSRVFKISKGNVGTALLNWIANIKDFNNNTILIQSPNKAEGKTFDGLNKELKIFLVQFTLHKRMTAEKLVRVTLEDPQKIEQTIRYMKRAGLINELAGKVYEIDKYIYLQLKDYLYGSFDQKD